MSRSKSRPSKDRRPASHSLAQQQPLANQARQLLDNIIQLVDLKQTEAAIKLVGTLLEVDPANPEGLYLQGELHLQHGKLAEALQCFTMAVYQRPNDAKIFGYLAKLHAQFGHYSASISAMHRLIELKPKDAQAMKTLAALYYITGRKERGSYWVSQAAWLEPFSYHKHKTMKTPRLRVLGLRTAESTEWTLNIKRFSPAMREGHNNLVSLLDSENIEITQLFVDHIDRAPEILRKLPKVDLIYNGITDADRCAEALAKAHLICEKLGVPVINPPQAVLKTNREDNYQCFKDDPALIVPKSFRLDGVQGSTKALLEGAMAAHGFELPLIVRLAGFQGGKYMHKVDDLESHDFSELDIELEKQAHSLYIIQYHEVGFSDARLPTKTLYPKYRAFYIDGKLYPTHCLIGLDNYNVHMANHRENIQKYPWLSEFYTAYVEQPEEQLPPGMWAALRDGMETLGLGYVGVDFAVIPSGPNAGKLLIFEANPAMRNFIEVIDEGTSDYAASSAAVVAASTMFCRMAGVEPWDFKLPRGKVPTTIVPIDVECLPKQSLPDYATSNHRWLAERLGQPNDFSDSPFFNTRYYIDEELLEHTAQENNIQVQRYPGRMLEFTKDGRQVVFHINAPRIPMDVMSLDYDKVFLKKLFQRHGIPTPEGSDFTEFDAAYRYFAGRSRPQVVKPVNRMASRGVSVHVTTPGQFQAAWEKAVQVGKKVLVEDMIQGEELRVYFIGGDFIAATARTPAFVIGDGKLTIAELINEENQQRLKNPITAKVLISDTPALDRAGLRLNEVPMAGEWVVLGDTHMATKGAEYVALGKPLPLEVIESCAHAARMLPSQVVGVDVFIENFGNPEQHWITEVNASTPAIGGLFHYPRYGEKKDIAEFLLKYSFEKLASPIEADAGILSPAKLCEPISVQGSDFTANYLQVIACAHNLPCQRLDEHHDALLLGNPTRLGWVEGVSTHTALESVQILRHPDWLHSRLQAFDIPSEIPENAFEVRVLMAGHRLLAAHANQDGSWHDVSESLHQGIADVASRAMHAIYSPGHALLTLNLTALDEHPESAGWSLGFVDLQPDLSVFYTTIDRPRDVISALLAVWWPDYDQAVEQPVAQRLNLTGRWHEVQVGAANWLQQQMDRHMLEGEVQALESGAFEVHVQGQPNAVQAFTEHCRFAAFVDAVELSEADLKTPALANTDVLTLRLVITGKVQGVGYRRWFANQLTERGIAGWVRNLSDGSVEAVIHGPQDTLQPLLDEVPVGSKNADVTGLNAELWEGELPQGVQVLADAAPYKSS